MDPQTASYYRAILFNDGQDSRPLPPSLLALHAWAVKRCQAMGLGSTIAKNSALAVAMTWMSTTKEGKEFTREFTTIPNMFDDDSNDEPVNQVDWDEVEHEAPVLVKRNGGDSTPGEFCGRQSKWLIIRIAGEMKKFRSNQVQLVGA